MSTMTDVAKAAGVSRFTVSKVFQNDPSVKAAIRARVHAAAEKLHYTPNPYAVSLVRGKTAGIGMVVSQIVDPFYGEIIETADREARRNGQQLLIQCSYGDPALEEKIVRHFLSIRVLGIILAPCVTPENADFLAGVSTAIPLVYIDRIIRAASHYVVNDHFGSARMVTAHLLARKRVPAYLGSSQSKLNRAIADRERGYVETVRAAGKEPLLIPAAAATVQRDNEQFGFENVIAWLKAHPAPTSLFCATDAIALGAMRALEQQGAIPGKTIHVAGHDDLSFSAYTHPPLTTVRQPKPELAAASIDAIMRLSQRKSPGRTPFIRIKLKSTLIVRESTGGEGQ